MERNFELPTYQEMPFITRVGVLLLDAKGDSTVFINTTGCDYTAEDLMNVCGPLLDGEKCTYSVRYNKNKSKAFLDIY